MRIHGHPLIGRILAACVLAGAFVAACGCAVGLPPGGPIASQPIARMSLRPEYRVFHDALVDYGSWILIEPHGFVFRPRVNFDSWRPYYDGFWVPTDSYGWVWVSAEPFGWATYHYGKWFRDEYQGWVWVAGIDWGPSWVTWSTSGPYAGWTPLSPVGASLSSQADATSWVPAANLGATNLKQFVRSASALGSQLGSVRPADNPTAVEGVVVNTGPSIEWVEQQAGSLKISRLEDMVPTRGKLVLDEPLPLDAPAPGAEPSGAPGVQADPGAERLPIAISAQRAAERVAREARLAQRGGSLQHLQVVRPFGVPSARGAADPVRFDSDTLR